MLPISRQPLLFFGLFLLALSSCLSYPRITKQAPGTSREEKEGPLDVGGRKRCRISLPHFTFITYPSSSRSAWLPCYTPFFQPLRGRWDALS